MSGGRRVLVEAAVDSLESAIEADADGVDRVEVCGPLHDGGTTPSMDLVRQVIERVRVPVHVLVRPRYGDFVYDAGEIAAMTASIGEAKALGAAGIATGALTRDAAVDQEAMAGLIAAARPLRVCFHRAFDQVTDQFAALETLVSLGIDLVLTSGAAPTALEGAQRLAALVQCARDRIAVVAAGSITAGNVVQLVNASSVKQLHGRAFRGLKASAGKILSPSA
jgi:copper homeostasis protein